MSKPFPSEQAVNDSLIETYELAKARMDVLKEYPDYFHLERRYLTHILDALSPVMHWAKIRIGK